MLVTSVVLRPTSRTVAAAIAEAAEAFDNPSVGAIFAILADDNASASDRLDGFVGQLMVEAASAAVIVDAGSIRNAAIVEQTNAGATFGGIVPHLVPAAVDESAIAADVLNSTVVSPTIGDVVETATAVSVQDASTAGVVVYAAVLDGTFVDPGISATLLGTEVLDSGPVTAFEP